MLVSTANSVYLHSDLLAPVFGQLYQVDAVEQQVFQAALEVCLGDG